MGNLGVPELVIIFALLVVGLSIWLAVRSRRKKRAQYPPHYPPPYGQYPPQYPPPGQPPQGPYPPHQGP